MEILQRFQNGIIAPWYVSNDYMMISTYHTLETRLKDSARDTAIK